MHPLIETLMRGKATDFRLRPTGGYHPTARLRSVGGRRKAHMRAAAKARRARR
jgi:hypothetical protein